MADFSDLKAGRPVLNMPGNISPSVPPDTQRPEGVQQATSQRAAPGASRSNAARPSGFPMGKPSKHPGPPPRRGAK